MTAEPHCSAVLRAVRAARGVTQAGWAARLGVGRTTVQRWESGETVPDPGAEAAILAYCREVNLFRPVDRGPLAGLNLTPDLLQDLIAGARIEGVNRQPAVTTAEGPALSGVDGPATGSQARATQSSVPDRSGPALSPQHSNLPLPLTSFVGRQQELAAVRRLQVDTRLLTLTGAGGVGKTRLALALAQELRWAYPHGVCFVELAALADPALVPDTVAAAVGIQTVAQRPLRDVLVEQLAPRHLLLILDNCEHLLPACAELVAMLLRTCPHLEVLTTSREPLGVEGEAIWRVPPMAVPRWETADADRGPWSADREPADAVRLFAERARLYRPDFALTNAGVPVVVTVCARLDGIPLAIELAAAWVKVLSVEQIAERLTDRFRLLTSGSRTALPRQQTLRATLDWSHDLLADAERVLLRRLSVFAGSFALEAAEAVCGDGERGAGSGERVAADGPAPRSPLLAPTEDVLDLLAHLVDKSLVIADEQGEAVRYRLLETVRQYAAERLVAAGEVDATRDRHVLWCLALAEAAWSHRDGPGQQTWLEHLTTEHDNLRAALGWCLAGERGGPLGLQLAAWLWWWWHVRGHLDEGRRWLAALLERGSHAPLDARARALEGAAWLAAEQGDYDAATRQGEECLALCREIGEKIDIGRALNNVGVAYGMSGDLARAQELHEENLALARELGDPKLIASALNNLGILARERGESDRAAPLYEESLALARKRADAEHVVATLLNLGHVYQEQGALDQAMTCYRESLTLSRDLGNRQAAARCLQGMASVAVARGDAVRAARLCGAATALREALGVQVPAAGRASLERITAGARAALGEAAFTAAWTAGQALSFEAAVSDALCDAAPA